MTRAEEKILVVDDSAFMRKVIRRLVEEHDLGSVIEAQDGAEAVALYQSQSPDLVLMDDTMSGKGGMEAMREILADFPSAKIIICSALGTDYAAAQALRAGACNYLIKPFKEGLFVTAVKSTLNGERMLPGATHRHALDPNTGLLNKGAFYRTASSYVAAHPDKDFLIICWDIDHFKIFNDYFGFQTGDKLLAEVGKACRVHSNNMVHSIIAYGYFGADQFAMCVVRSDHVVDEVCAMLTEIMQNLDYDYRFIISIGISKVSAGGENISLDCDHALLAKKSVKKRYGNKVAWYEPSMRTKLIKELDIVSRMQPALENGEFHVWFQPQIDCSAKRICGAEALVRWVHPELGIIPPDRFIPVFEDNGFITAMDRFVWEQACRFQRKLLDEGFEVVPISLNISRKDIYAADVPAIFEELLREYDIPVSLLHLEITESTYMENPERVTATLNGLQELGFEIEMDDFGSGFSSLNTLKKMPLSTLKLDMKFLEEGGDEHRGKIILDAVVRMSSALGMRTIAEGVETKPQMEFMEGIGCKYMQGFYFAKPMPQEHYRELLLCDDLLT